MKSFFYDLCKFYNDSRSFSLSQARSRIAGHYFSVTPHLIFFFHNKHNQHVTAQYTSFANVCAIFLLPLLKLNFLRCSIVDKKQLSSPKHYWKWVILNPLHPSKLKPLLPMVLLTGLPFHVKHDMLIKKKISTKIILRIVLKRFGRLIMNWKRMRWRAISWKTNNPY